VDVLFSSISVNNMDVFISTISGNNVDARWFNKYLSTFKTSYVGKFLPLITQTNT